MADLARSLAALQSLFADNTSGDISAQDLRDFLVAAYQPQGVFDHYIGLEDGVAVSSSDQTGKSVIYANALKGNRLGLSDGSAWTMFTAPKFALGGLTGLTSDKNYDLFAAYSTPTHASTDTGTDVVTWSANPGWTTGTYVIVTSTASGLTAGTDYWYNRASGTTGSFHTTLADAIAGSNKVNLTGNVTQTLIGVFMDLGPTWDTGSGSDTARGTGAGSTAIELFNGAWVNTNSVTGSIGAGTIAAKAGRHVATVRTTGTTTVEDSLAKRFVWNRHNPQPRTMRVIDTTNSWSTSDTAWNEFNNSTSNRVQWVTGDASTQVDGHMVCIATTGVATLGRVAIGVDGLTPSGLWQQVYSGAATNIVLTAFYVGQPGLGFHYLQALEQADGGSTTFYGDNGGATQAGIYGSVMG